MPLYDYMCPECGLLEEYSHGMNENPTYTCPCNGIMKKVFNSFNLSNGKSRLFKAVKDKVVRESDYRADLKENYGVESIAPIRRTTVSEVYNDVKSQGSLVRDQMQANKELETSKREIRQREWKQGAMKRAPNRSRELVHRREVEAQQKRAIKLK
jgi:putative FmdB family regulatory protein